MGRIVHHTPHAVHQTVVIRQRGGFQRGGGGKGGGSFRDRQTKAVAGVFGHANSMRWHRPFRPDAELTPEQLWQVYRMCGDLRAAVDSIARRVSTQAYEVTSKIDPAADAELYRRSLEQQAAVTAGLSSPNDDDDWRQYWEKVCRDALVFWHGTAENVFERVAHYTAAGIEIARGPLTESVPVYAPSIHPIPDESGRLLGYVQVADHFAGDPSDINFLSKDQIVRLVLQPNTRSPYAVPIIETVVREVTTLVRGSERAMYTMDRSEIPPGFLVLTGLPPKVKRDVAEAAENHGARDHKLRIIHSHGATSPAQWLQIQQTMKEIELIPVSREAKKIIWRNYGVTGVEMGDLEDANRASSDAELDVGSSHLVEPLLEAIAQVVVKSWIPHIVRRHERDPDAEVLVKFEFKIDRAKTPDENKTDAEAAKTRLESGQTTINEERTAAGRPRVDGGDVIRVGEIPIGEPSALDAESAREDSDDERSECGPGCAHGNQPHAVAVLLTAELAATIQSRKLRLRAANDLPSDWQPAGRFRGQRVMDLSDLFDEVTSYRRAVEPIWRRAESEVLAVTGAAWRSGTVGNSEHLRKIGQALAVLRTEWSVITQRRYRNAAEVGAAGAVKATGSSVVGDGATERADVYFEQAMAWLDGLISDLQTRVIANVQAVRSAYRAGQTADPGLGPDSELDDLLGAIDHAFGANEHRIDNWSGRLVELANVAMLAGMLAHKGSDDAPAGEVVIVDPDDADPDLTPDGTAPGTEWWVSWEYVGDERMCPTCEDEGSKPIRPASSLSTVPGGDTECRARCRCVLVYWTAAEVATGDAEKVNP